MSWFVYLSKALPTFIYPIGLTFHLLIGALLAFKSERWRLRFLIAAFLILFIFGLPFPGAFLTRWLESSYPPLAEGAKADIIVVLGGGTESNETPRSMVELSGAGDRILYAAKLYHEGRAEKILFGGAYITELSGEKTSVASEMASVAEMLNVPDEAILLQETSLNTAEEAVADAKILAELGVDRVILVTSATHMFRSVKLFEKQGLTVLPAPTDYSYSDAEWETLMTFKPEKWYTYLIPTSGNIRAFENAVKEYLGIFVYRIRGWM